VLEDGDLLGGDAERGGAVSDSRGHYEALFAAAAVWTFDWSR
jgi:hypothetical protein